MGAGNPSLRSYDNDLFVPTTYFVDFTNGLEDEDEDSFFDDFNVLEDITEGLCSELKLTNLSDNKGNFETDSNLVSTFHGYGLLLLEGDKCLVISEAGSDNDHVPFAVIPNFKFENVFDEIEHENRDKEDWYDARRLSFSNRIEVLAEKKWNKLMKEFHKEEKMIVDKLKQFYPESLSVRNGPWCSSKVA